MIRLRADGRAKLVTSEDLSAVPLSKLIAWCYETCRYTIVTAELIVWLRDQISGVHAIEVAAGTGDLGYRLCIHQSDAGLEADPVARLVYALAGQRAPEPPPDVQRLDANTAVELYRPDVVIASYLTQRSVPGDEGYSSIMGADEFEIIARAKYIHIGNIGVHQHKRILALKHKELTFPWLWTRSQRPELNRIWIWERGAKP